VALVSALRSVTANDRLKNVLVLDYQAPINLDYLAPPCVVSYDFTVMRRLTAIRVLDGYHVWVRFDDGVEGDLDFSAKPRTGVYAAWNDYEYFRRAHVGEYGDLVWDDQVDFSADSLWLQLTGRTREKLIQAPGQAKGYA
jgi:hypothetical protein